MFSLHESQKGRHKMVDISLVRTIVKKIDIGTVNRWTHFQCLPFCIRMDSVYSRPPPQQTIRKCSGVYHRSKLSSKITLCFFVFFVCMWIFFFFLAVAFFHSVLFTKEELKFGELLFESQETTRSMLLHIKPMYFPIFKRRDLHGKWTDASCQLVKVFMELKRKWYLES